MKIFICAAGSGGHIYPALSLAEEFKNNANKFEIIFLATRRNIEKIIFKKTNYKVRTIDSLILPAKYKKNWFIFFLNYLYFLIEFIKVSAQIFFLIIKIKPDIVVGFGGISSVPTVFAAKILNIPTVIHEQNVLPGLANKFLANLATKVATGFKETENYLKRNDNIVFTGNPIRKDLKYIEKKEARRSLGLDEFKFTILVFGGSQGSSFINNNFIQALKRLPENLRHNLQLISLVGYKDEERVRSEYKALNIFSIVLPYLFDMSFAYSAADLVICRSGAITLSEITYFGKAAILVPYPYAQAHQLYNAKVMQQAQAAVIVPQDNNCICTMSKLVSFYLQEKDELIKMAKASRELSNQQAAAKLKEVVNGLIENKRI